MGGVYLSASPTLVRKTLESAPDPACAWWSATPAGAPGNSTPSSRKASWLLAPVKPDLIFGPPSKPCGKPRFAGLGAEPSMLHGSSGVH